MADYWVCSDNIDGKENSRIEALCSALKKNGHTAHNGGVGPNTIQSHGQTSGSNGQIGVFICGGVDIQVFWDFVQGLGRYYHYKRFIYVYASETATTDKWLTCNGAKNTPTVQAHDDNYSGGRGDAIGKTVHQYCSEHKDKIWYACGKLGCTFDDVIQNFLKGEGAGSDSDSDSGGTSSGGTIKEALQKLLTYWDGEVECYIRDDEVHINKIREPQKYYSSVLYEGVNVFADTVNLTDINPTTCNYLEVVWTGGTVTIQDEAMIKRFGMVKTTVLANSETATEDENDKDTKDATKSIGDEAVKKAKETLKSSTKSDAKKKEEDEKNVTTVNADLIDNEKDAKEYAQLYWNKLQRENGRNLECQTWGSCAFKTGEWCKVYLPSFNLDGFMYITSCSQSNDNGDWTTSLKLVDYPPGWGKYEPPQKEEEETEDTESTDEETTDTETTE